MSNKLLTMKVIRAKQMAVSGYVTKVIVLETGLSYKAVRALIAGMKNEGIFFKTPRSSHLNDSGSIIQNEIQQIHASVLMGIYLDLGGELVERSVDIDLLNRAFHSYKLNLKFLKEHCPRHPILRNEFTISQAWTLAQELRSEQATFHTCGKCGARYVETINMNWSAPEDYCPFCRLQSKFATEKGSENGKGTSAVRSDRNDSGESDNEGLADCDSLEIDGRKGNVYAPFSPANESQLSYGKPAALSI